MTLPVTWPMLPQICIHPLPIHSLIISLLSFVIRQKGISSHSSHSSHEFAMFKNTILNAFVNQSFPNKCHTLNAVLEECNPKVKQTSHIHSTNEQEKTFPQLFPLSSRIAAQASKWSSIASFPAPRKLTTYAPSSATRLTWSIGSLGRSSSSPGPSTTSSTTAYSGS